jgi:predicted GIY-YIG superfamily endonuclease
MTFWTYILRCRDGSYYTGHTEALESRIAAHQSGQIAAHTRSRRPVALAWSQDFPTRLEALEAERRIKGWSRAKKEALIAGDWHRLSHLARNRQTAHRPSTHSGRTGVEKDRSPTVRAEPFEARPAKDHPR